MSMNRNQFTPWSAPAGDALIELAAALFLLLNGRIAGVSGVMGGLLKPLKGDIGWGAAFTLGLVCAPMVYGLYARLPVPQIEAANAALIAAGLMVGIGTRYGSGCTSGHGVCDVSRLSPQSLVATTCFMGAGFATVFVIRHFLTF